jgi:hypothetical protein
LEYGLISSHFPGGGRDFHAGVKDVGACREKSARVQIAVKIDYRPSN